MRVQEIIRNILDIIDDIERQQPEPPIEDMGYEEKDAKRFQQIADLATDKQYTTEPQEQYAGINSVTTDAGADSWQGTKDPADIRGTTTRVYGDN